MTLFISDEDTRESAIELYRGAGRIFIDPKYYGLNGEQINALRESGVMVEEQIPIENGPELLSELVVTEVFTENMELAQQLALEHPEEARELGIEANK